MKKGQPFPRNSNGPPYRGPSFKKVLMLDYPLGIPRLRGWPTNYTKKRTPAQQKWIDWFKWTLDTFRYLPGEVQTNLIESTHGTPFMPTDFFIASQAQTLFYIIDEKGRMLVPEFARTSVSESLDAIGNPENAILYRGQQVWQPLAPGAAGKFLRSNGPSSPPSYETPSGAGFWQSIGTGSIVSGVLQVTGLDFTGFDICKIRIQGVQIGTAEKQLYLQFFQNGAWQTSGYQHQSIYWTTSGVASNNSSSSSLGIFNSVSGATWGLGDQTTQNFAMEAEIPSPADDTLIKNCTFRCSWDNDAGVFIHSLGGGRSFSFKAIEGIRLKSFNTDDIIAGKMLIQAAAF